MSHKSIDNWQIAVSPTPAPLPLPTPIPIVQKATPISCDEICSKSGGVKKCEFKKKRTDRKVLIAECEAKKEGFWSRITHKNKNRLGIDCRDL